MTQNQSKHQSSPKMMKVRTTVPIYYSTTTNTAKKFAYSLGNKLEENDFITMITNVGDYDPEEFLQQTGPVALILATYGNGGSPNDGQEFRNWIQKLEGNNTFQKMDFSILALGNRSFEHFCGNGKYIRECFLKLGGKQINNAVYCDSSSNDNKAENLFPNWSDNLVQTLKQKYELKQMPITAINKKFNIKVIQEVKENWEQQISQSEMTISPEFTNYLKTPKAKIIHIKELRQKDDGRSSLWIRAEIPQGIELDPACNISVCPLNVRQQNEESWEGSIQITKIKKDKEFPLPPIPLEEYWKLANFTQLATIDTIKSALKYSQVQESIQNKYKEIIKDPNTFEEKDIRCGEVYEALKPGYQFLAQLGINSVRPYTLSSWDQEQKYFDLVVSLLPKGLTSRYFQSLPREIRINPLQSSFYVPMGRPIIMIANGSGIAPFRSLTQYLLKTIPEENQLPITLYYGIQNKDNDFFFGEEWIELEKQGKIKLRIAESRAGEDKVYVQDLIKEDRLQIKKHLFDDFGVIFMCGGNSMAKSVDTQLFEAIKMKQKIPFKAFKLSKQLVKNKTIVKQVYH